MSVPRKFRGYAFTVEDWLALCEMHDNRCARCGEEKPLTVDHIKPRSVGGTDDISNIQPLCRSCNSSKCSSYDGARFPRLRGSKRMSARLTATCRALMDVISTKLGVSDAAVIEMAVREYADRHGYQVPHRPESQSSPNGAE